MGVVAALALYAVSSPVRVAAQEANLSTMAASLGSGTVTSRINLEAVRPAPAADRRLTLPSLTVIDDGSGPRVTSLVLDLPVIDLEAVSVASRVGDQPLPAVFRTAPLAGSALTAPIRGLTLTTTGARPLNLSFGQMGTVSATGTPTPGSPAVAAAALSFTPSSRFLLTPRVLIDGGSDDARRSVGTAMQANVAGNLALVTDVGMAGTADTTWAPLASARLVGQWPRAGIETSVLRGAAAPRAEANRALVPSRDREAVQAHVQPLAGLTFAALTSLSRSSADPEADGTATGMLRIAYGGLPAGQLAAARQRETTGSRETNMTSLEWRQRWLDMAVRYVHQSVSALDRPDEGSSRLEVELPALSPRGAGLDLRAALMAASSSQTDPEVNYRVSGRLGLLADAALTGETELGLTGGDGQVLRALRVMTEMPVVPATRLQLSYSYLTGPQFPLGQMFEARIVRRLRVGW
jgi:hypothetical protein